MKLARTAPIVLLACLLTAGPLALHSSAKTNLNFRHQELEANFDVGYAVLTADVNHDGRLDIVAINPTQAVWFENPSWQKHVILDGKTETDNVCIAANDIDGDGKLDLALGAAWRPNDTKDGGTLQWITPQGAASEPWTLHSLLSEPTLHRMRWADVDGDGKQELLVSPLQGPARQGRSGGKVMTPDCWSCALRPIPPPRNGPKRLPTIRSISSTTFGQRISIPTLPRKF